jgi:pimeloyl-ACP methyl ester carboxylesterase
MQVRYYAYEASWDKAGPLFVEMPGEGSVSGCGAPSLVRAFNGLILCPEHRFFGTTSVPGNSSSTANLRFLSVEQNLADVKAIVGDAKRVYSTSVPVVAIGGSYSGASAAWARMTYPETFSSAISESGPVEATLDYFAYDASNAAALLSPDDGGDCARRVRATTAALEAAFAQGQGDAVKKLFGSPTVGKPMGDTDFFYMAADSLSSAVQYGRKHLVCDNLKLLPVKPTQQQYIDGWANFTISSWGKRFAADCLYDSDCMRSSTVGYQMGRSWYWMKCSELAYLQTGGWEEPLRSKSFLTVDKLVQQCSYIYGKGMVPATAAFNARHGGNSPTAASRIFFLAYSDDPWHPACVNQTLSKELPFEFTTCDGCGHCGAGVPSATLTKLEALKESHLAGWLSL